MVFRYSTLEGSQDAEDNTMTTDAHTTPPAGNQASVANKETEAEGNDIGLVTPGHFTSPHRASFAVVEDETLQVDNREMSGLQVDGREMPGLEVDTDAMIRNDAALAKFKHDGYWAAPNRDGMYPEYLGAEKIAAEGVVPKKRRIRRTTMWLLIAIVVLLAVIGGVVGGLVGRKKSSEQTQSPGSSATSAAPLLSSTPQPSKPPTTTLKSSATPTPTPTSEFVTSGTTGMVRLPCPTASASIGSTVFDVHCGFDSDDYAFPRPDVRDIELTTQYSFDACMKRCANNKQCDSSVFSANLTLMLAGEHPGNCVLKSGNVFPTLRSWDWRVTSKKKN